MFYFLNTGKTMDEIMMYRHCNEDEEESHNIMNHSTWYEANYDELIAEYSSLQEQGQTEAFEDYQLSRWEAELERRDEESMERWLEYRREGADY